jgi:serine/threonine protein kinase
VSLSASLTAGTAATARGAALRTQQSLPLGDLGALPTAGAAKALAASPGSTALGSPSARQPHATPSSSSSSSSAAVGASGAKAPSQPVATVTLGAAQPRARAAMPSAPRSGADTASPYLSYAALGPPGARGAALPPSSAAASLAPGSASLLSRTLGAPAPGRRGSMPAALSATAPSSGALSKALRKTGSEASLGSRWDWDVGLTFAPTEGSGISACEEAGYMFGAAENGIRGKAGTPGFWAPEMLFYERDGKGRRYGPAADWWSFGCLIFALLSAKGPFTVVGGDTADDNAATLQNEPELPTHIFSPAASSLLRGLLQKDPTKRLGCGPTGAEEIMAHPFFASLDWSAIANKTAAPPFKPTMNVLESTKSVRGWSEKDKAKLASVTLGPADQVRYKGIPFTSQAAVYKEIIQNMALREYVEDYLGGSLAQGGAASLSSSPSTPGASPKARGAGNGAASPGGMDAHGASGGAAAGGHPVGRQGHVGALGAADPRNALGPGDVRGSPGQGIAAAAQLRGDRRVPEGSGAHPTALGAAGRVAASAVQGGKPAPADGGVGVPALKTEIARGDRRDKNCVVM